MGVALFGGAGAFFFFKGRLSDAECRKMSGVYSCERSGNCSANDAHSDCVAKSAADCKQSTECKRGGKCDLKGEKCVVASSESCKGSEDCKSSGACTLIIDECKAGSQADCQQSESCKKSGGGFGCGYVESSHTCYEVAEVPMTEVTPSPGSPAAGGGSKCPSGTHEYNGGCASCPSGCTYAGGGMCKCKH